jgi:hypothetical protein
MCGKTVGRRLGRWTLDAEEMIAQFIPESKPSLPRENVSEGAERSSQCSHRHQMVGINGLAGDDVVTIGDGSVGEDSVAVPAYKSGRGVLQMEDKRHHAPASNRPSRSNT